MCNTTDTTDVYNLTSLIYLVVVVVVSIAVFVVVVVVGITLSRVELFRRLDKLIPFPSLLVILLVSLTHSFPSFCLVPFKPLTEFQVS